METPHPLFPRVVFLRAAGAAAQSQSRQRVHLPLHRRRPGPNRRLLCRPRLPGSLSRFRAPHPPLVRTQSPRPLRPGRLDTAYCSLPFAGLAIAFAGMAEAGPIAALAVFFLLWLPLDLHELRIQRREKLARDNDARAWVTTWDRYARGNTPPDTVI